MNFSSGPRGEFVYQLFSLLIAFILVHGLYVALIRPGATTAPAGGDGSACCGVSSGEGGGRPAADTLM